MTRVAAGTEEHHASYGSFAILHDPDGNTWLLQEVTTRLPGRIDDQRDVVRVDRRPRRARCDVHRSPTARTRLGSARPIANWPDWYAAYMVAEQAGTPLPE